MAVFYTHSGNVAGNDVRNNQRARLKVLAPKKTARLVRKEVPPKNQYFVRPSKIKFTHYNLLRRRK